MPQDREHRRLSCEIHKARRLQTCSERRSPLSSSCDNDSQTQHMIKKLSLVLRCLVSPPSRSWTSAALHKPNVLVSLRRHIKTKRDRADVSCQNINSDKACPGTKSSSGSPGSGGITRHRRLVITNVNQKEYTRTQSPPLHCVVSLTSRSWSTSLDVCSSAQKHKRRPI